MRFQPLAGWLLFSLCLVSTVVAQSTAPVTLRGVVYDAETNRPLEGAHVFIASSMIGTATGPDGRFRLDRVPPGAHRLIVTMVGFTPAMEEVLLRGDPPAPFTIRLEPTVIEVEGLTVTASRDRRWEKRLQRFEDLFLGESDFAQQCRILNPEVLDFEGKWWGKFAATASRPLLVENRALGYRVQYYLKNFELKGATLRYDGEPFFEELEPESPEQRAMWDANRRKAFEGSFRHFLLALLADSCRDKGFILSLRPATGLHNWSSNSYPVRPRMLLKEGPTPSEKLLRFAGYVEILYLNELEDDAFHRWQGRHHATARGNQRSFIRLTDGPTLIDHTGEVIDPYGITTYGYFAFERIAELLPKEYRPDLAERVSRVE